MLSTTVATVTAMSVSLPERFSCAAITRKTMLARPRGPNLLIGIGNSHADSVGYGANGMLALIVNRKGDTLYGRHEIEFEDWKQVGHFFAANRELLSDPERLRAAARGEEMVVVPTLRFSDSPASK